MPLDLTGIQNVGEFYSHHYLDALLENDLKGILKKWDEVAKKEEGASSSGGVEAGPRTPDRALAALANSFFDTRARVRDTVTLQARYTEGHAWHVALLETLGYEPAPRVVEIKKNNWLVPLLSTVRKDGQEHLWILEVPFPNLRPAVTPGDAADVALTQEEITDADQLLMDQEDSIWTQYLIPEQLVGLEHQMKGLESAQLAKLSLEDLPGQLFATDEPPRWLLLLAGSHVVLADRTKWAQGKHLLFDLDEILGRKLLATLRATAALLSRDSLAPEEGSILHDTLDENSHKHAYAVSADLKLGVREAVELLANEAVWYLRHVRKDQLFFDQETDRAKARAEGERLATDLTRDCLRYLYRLLFLFYAEARGGELGVVPMESEAYRLGYSLESLRDLEQVPITTDQARQGYFLHNSLQTLFKIVNEGYGDEPLQLDIDYATEGQAIDQGFTITGLQSDLFEPAHTPILSKVKFRNAVLQEVLQLLSLSRDTTKKGKGGRGKKKRGGKARKQRGRISYAQLGINQLGAVYEGLLSYRGFFAQEPLYEVKPAGTDPNDPKTQTYFISERDAGKYKSDEFVYDEDEAGERHRRVYSRGRFIFRVAGRDREKSASYYTPEVLTSCLVKYSLKELLRDKSADEILELTVCEPAMGSGAFLNEAVNQIAEAYLERKQAELAPDKTIPPAEYQTELQRVKAYIAVHNCYGVDLNPTAVELAKVSLWLNTIYQGSNVPWFGPRLAVGNSLIGCRRAVYALGDTIAGKWWENSPTLIPVGEPRPKNTIYHFLLPDAGMSPFDKDKVVKSLAPEAVKTLAAWRKEFIKPYTKADACTLVHLSDVIDRLWEAHTTERQLLLREVRQPIPVWGQYDDDWQSGAHRRTISQCESLANKLDQPHTAHRRLKLVMDFWCALWFWPLDRANRLPTRDLWIELLQHILPGAEIGDSAVDVAPAAGQLDLFVQATDEEKARLTKAYEGITAANVDDLVAKIPHLQIAAEISNQPPFLHWELTFADLFASRGGFDLVVGNPPWVKVQWIEAGILGDLEPTFALRKMSAKKISDARASALNASRDLAEYLWEFERQSATKGYLCAEQSYPLLRGVQTNLYKCFVTRAWQLGANSGVSSFIHQEAPYDDPKGGHLREHLYPRLILKASFRNELRMFTDIDNHAPYCLNIYVASPRKMVSFATISNLFHPATIDRCFQHDGKGSVSGIRNADGKWDLRGHRNRIVRVDRDRLALFARLYDPPGTSSLQARLPVVHSEETVSVLDRFASQSHRLGDFADTWHATVMFDETYAQRDGIIKRETRFPTGPTEWVLSGPHFYVGTPLNKTPNEGCSTQRDYTCIDLTEIPDDYLPRTNYVPACSLTEYQQHIPRWNGKPLTEFYRHVNRRQIVATNERTYVPAICPPEVAHIHPVLSAVFQDYGMLARFSGLSVSLVYDFFIRSTGKSDLYGETLGRLPFPDLGQANALIVHRTLRLNCLTTHYAEFWSECFEPSLPKDGFSKADERLGSWSQLTRKWRRDSALRTPYERRQILVELDALAAVGLELTEEELVTLYRVQFPVLLQYEQSTFYDARGMIVFTTNKGLSGVGLTRSEFEFWQEHVESGRSLPLDFDTQGFVPRTDSDGRTISFDRCDREDDLRQAYRHFSGLVRDSR